jgi:hypothetical protein
MPFLFLNLAILAGLAAVAIPPIIHLLNRRRYDIVDWGAMQFLHVSERTRRKIFLEELLLMLLRMGLIGLLVLALAAPQVRGWFLAKMGLGVRGNRDVVLLIDGSASMARPEKGSPAEAAYQWCQEFLDGLQPGDRVAVLRASRPSAEPFLANPPDDPAALLTNDFDQAKTDLANPKPSLGGVDFPAAVGFAFRVLQASPRGQCEVIVLTDGQRYGWTDKASLDGWRALSYRQTGTQTDPPPVRVVNLAPDRPADLPRWELMPLEVAQAVVTVGQPAPIRTELRRFGQGAKPPAGKVQFTVDGQPPPAGSQDPPLESGGDKLQYSLSYTFETPGPHLVTVKAGASQQDLAVQVMPPLPVLLVDGDPPRGPREKGGTDYLEAALAPRGETVRSVVVRVVSADRFDPADLTQPLETGAPPAVLVLCKVPALSQPQRQAVERFLSHGGGVLVTLGPDVNSDYETNLFNDGKGWLPARPVEPTPEEPKLENAARVKTTDLTHPALEPFKEPDEGGLSAARFSRYWKLALPDAPPPAAAGEPEPAKSAVIARLTTGDPFLVEKPFGKGKVILSAVPLDASWRTNLQKLPSGVFLMMANRLAFYLGGDRANEVKELPGPVNLQPGQPIRYRPPTEEKPGPVRVRRPDSTEVLLEELPDWPAVYDRTERVGVYQLSTRGGSTGYFVVQSDPQELDLTPYTDAEGEQVAALVKGLTYQPKASAAEVAKQPRSSEDTTPDQEFWWLVMLAVLGLLAGEVWMTGRMARRG